MSYIRQVDICNQLGLHARAAAKLVKLASRYPCEIQLEKGEERINAKSIMGVMMLAAAKGSQLRVIADGRDEQAAADAIADLVAARFGEDR